MEKKKALNIDLDELCEAMEDHSYEHEYYLDLETGEILFISEYTDDEETGKLKDKIEEEFEHYERIPKVESHEGYEDMEDFIATVENCPGAISIREDFDPEAVWYVTPARTDIDTCRKLWNVHYCLGRCIKVYPVAKGHRILDNILTLCVKP